MSEDSTPTVSQENSEEKFAYAEFVQKTMDEFLSKADVSAVYGDSVEGFSLFSTC